jgi:hypothetical protein
MPAMTSFRALARCIALTLLATQACSAVAGESIRILVQSSPLAGSQYYALGTLAAQMKVGDELQLRREPDNRHDPHAVLVLWRGEKLGYLPRKENRAVAKAMDDGMTLRANVSKLHADRTDPWKRLEVAVLVEL